MPTSIVPSRYIKRADLITLLDRIFPGEYQIKVNVLCPLGGIRLMAEGAFRCLDCVEYFS